VEEEVKEEQQINRSVVLCSVLAMEVEVEPPCSGGGGGEGDLEKEVKVTRVGADQQ
jgi:hypothetical protein